MTGARVAKAYAERVQEHVPEADLGREESVRREVAVALVPRDGKSPRTALYAQLVSTPRLRSQREESQVFPDAIHREGSPGWPSVVLRPGETYRHVMVHRFGVLEE